MSATVIAAPPASSTRRSWVWIAVGAVVTAAVVLSFTNASTGVEGTDMARANPVPREEPFLGVGNWPMLFSVLFCVVAVLLLGTLGYRSWRARTMHRALIVLIAVTLLSLLDPPANWVSYTAFDPRFLHFETAWTWLNLAPTVEPLPNVPGYPMYYGMVGLTAGWATRKFLLTGRARAGWAGRHPLWTALGIGFLVGILWDIPTELFMIRAQMYLYSETWGPSITIHDAHYPIVWGFFVWSSIALTTLMLVPDDRGRSHVLSAISSKLRQRRGRGPAISVPREILAGMAILTAGYILCMGIYGTLRVTGASQPAADNKWPYTEMKIYDPYDHWKDKGLQSEAGYYK